MSTCCFTFSASAQLAFVDVTLDRGLGQYVMAEGMGSGVSAADFDDDGDIDLFLPTAAGRPNRVYRNRGDGFFDEVAASLGLASLVSSRMGLWFEADGDGDLDIMQSAREDDSVQMLRLLENQSQVPMAHWIALVPRSSGANTHGIGSVITFETDAGTQMRLFL